MSKYEREPQKIHTENLKANQYNPNYKFVRLIITELLD